MVVYEGLHRDLSSSINLLTSVASSQHLSRSDSNLVRRTTFTLGRLYPQILCLAPQAQRTETRFVERPSATLLSMGRYHLVEKLAAKHIKTTPTSSKHQARIQSMSQVLQTRSIRDPPPSNLSQMPQQWSFSKNRSYLKTSLV